MGIKEQKKAIKHISEIEYDVNEPKTEKLYLVLISTPGIFATLIRWFTRFKYIHIVLGMDIDLKESFSFGRRNPKVPILSGFEQEKMEEVIEKFPKALCMVSEIEQRHKRNLFGEE